MQSGNLTSTHDSFFGAFGAPVHELSTHESFHPRTEQNKGISCIPYSK